MRTLASVTAVMLFLFLLTSLPALSQDHDDHPQTQDEHARDRDKGKQNDHAGQQNENRRDDSHAQQDRHEHPEAGRSQEQSRPEQRDDHADRNRAQHEEQPQVDQRGRVEGGREGHAQRGERIPEDRYRASFGRGHRFHVDRDLIVNRGQPEFVYSGYTFELAQAWPVDWSYDDDCYIEQEEDGDYYLFDSFHPGFRILVFVIGG